MTAHFASLLVRCGGVQHTKNIAANVARWCAGHLPRPLVRKIQLAKAGDGCGPGWATSIPLVEPPNYDRPSAVAHRRREVGDFSMPDKIVMAHSKVHRAIAPS